MLNFNKMKQLAQYIQDAHQHGQTDDQIRTGLIKAGWDETQVDTALGNRQSAPLTQNPPTPPKPKGKRTARVSMIVFVLLLAACGLGVYFLDKYTATPSQPSVTLYYDDGRTLLWQDNHPAVEPTVQPTKAPYFVGLVRAELWRKYGNSYWQQGAWKVTTSLNANLQAAAEKLIADNLANATNRTGGLADEEATILQDVQTGQIKALVGGPDWSDPDHGQLNFATTPLAPGSSIKPFDYAALIEGTTDTGAGSVIADTTMPLPGWPCTNQAPPPPTAEGNCLEDYDFLKPGSIPIRYALGGNRNIPAVEAMYNAVPHDTSPGKTKSVNQVINLIDRMGATDGYNCYDLNGSVGSSATIQCYGAAAIGDGAYLTLADETHALSTFADGGREVPQTTIVSAQLNGKSKTTWKDPTGRQVIRPDTAYIINDIMSDPNASYLPGGCTDTTCTDSSDAAYKFQRDNGWHFAVDPGITNSGFDATMASWSTKYAVVSWVGNHARNVNISSRTGTASEVLTTPLTKGLMEAAHNGLTPTLWPKPSDIKTLPAFVLTNHIHYGDVEPSPATDLYPSWYRQ